MAPHPAITPTDDSYDVVIAGGAIMGTAAAWFIANDPAFHGRILIVERDPTYEFAATSLTGSCIRHQFSNAINIEISMFGTAFVRSFAERTGGPDITLKEFGYMFLVPEPSVPVLRETIATQNALGAQTELLDRDELARRFAYLNLDGVAAASFNGHGEGWFDAQAMFDFWRKDLRSGRRPVETVTNSVIALDIRGERVAGVDLGSGERITCGTFINAAGGGGAEVAAMAGIDLPLERRKRCTFVFECRNPPRQPLPLTIDPTGVYVRPDNARFLGAAVPRDDPAVAGDDFEINFEEFDDQLWPALANRIPAFEAIKMVSAWAGHYDYNTLDQNAIVGPHPTITNFVFMNGFSGHGIQQAPAIGRGMAELIVHGRYLTLDLSPLGYARVAQNRPFLEQAII